ncbi:xylulokinase [Lentilitoribacter sp. EG35]|uniref:xylulokinase n=1 Tax=Lentilitoribacter sp. EG35 TaxID=3234192 RepID=UPI0034602B44
MVDRLIIGLDSSTQSTKAIAWSDTGELVAEGRADIPMNTPRKNHFEQTPEEWWKATCIALKALTDQIDSSLIDGIAISNQRETIGFFDKNLEPLHPAIVWLDSRSISEVEELTEKIGTDQLHKISGKPKDIIPSHSRILWFVKNHPAKIQNLYKVLNVSSYLGMKLTGECFVSWPSADPSGVFDIKQMDWSSEILDVIGLDKSRFAEPVAPASPIGEINEEAALQTGLKAGTKLYAGAGDGQCAGLGVNAARKGRVYLNLGTAVVTGVWSQTPNISNSWRTMTSPTSDGYFLEGVMRAGTYFMDWFVENYIDCNADNSTYSKLQADGETLPVGTDGLLVCPYLSGCMNPFWNMKAKAAFYGISPFHDSTHLYRGAMEGLTGDIARTIHDMRHQGLPADEIVAVGGGANSALWRKMIVDATGIPLTISKSLEASALGAGMIAAVGANWFDNFDTAAQTMSTNGETYHPDQADHELWQPLLERQLIFNTFCCSNESELT